VALVGGQRGQTRNDFSAFPHEAQGEEILIGAMETGRFAGRLCFHGK
jgi:hypothetical protein